MREALRPPRIDLPAQAPSCMLPSWPYTGAEHLDSSPPAGTVSTFPAEPSPQPLVSQRQSSIPPPPSALWEEPLLKNKSLSTLAPTLYRALMSCCNLNPIDEQIISPVQSCHYNEDLSD